MGASTSHNPMALHGLLRDSVTFTFTTTTNTTTTTTTTTLTTNNNNKTRPSNEHSCHGTVSYISHIESNLLYNFAHKIKTLNLAQMWGVLSCSSRTFPFIDDIGVANWSPVFLCLGPKVMAATDLVLNSWRFMKPKDRSLSSVLMFRLKWAFTFFVWAVSKASHIAPFLISLKKGKIYLYKFSKPGLSKKNQRIILIKCFFQM
jgi:hypothetical protein